MNEYPLPPWPEDYRNADRIVYVDFINGDTAWYPIPPGKGWSINRRDRLLCIGVPGPERIMVPLDNVASFRLGPDKRKRD